MDSFNRVVQNMMTRWGGPATVVIVGASTYDPTTSESAPAESIYPVSAIQLDYTLQSNGQQAMPGTLIRSGDKQVFIQPTDILPDLKAERDFIVLGATRYRVVTSKALNPSQSSLYLYELFVRA